MVEVFEDLTIGSHTVQIWIRNSHSGTCSFNGGNSDRILLIEDYPDPPAPIVIGPTT